MIIRPMTIEDVPKLKLEADWMYQRFENYFQCEIGPAYIMEEDGQLLCAFGALFEWGYLYGGACEVWFNIINKTRVFSVVKFIKRYLISAAEVYKVKRMQAIVRCDSPVNNRFMRFMGFYNETPLGMRHKLHDGSDAFLYARYF